MRSENYGRTGSRHSRQSEYNADSAFGSRRRPYQDEYQNNHNSWNQRGADYGVQSEYESPYSQTSRNRHRDEEDRNIFQRAGDAIRDTWNDLTDRDKWNDDGYYQDQQGRSDREYSRSNGSSGSNARRQNDFYNQNQGYNWGNNSHYDNDHNRYRAAHDNEYSSMGRGSYNSQGRGSYYSGGRSGNNNRQGYSPSRGSDNNSGGQYGNETNYNRNGNYSDAQHGAYGSSSDRYGDDNYYTGWDSEDNYGRSDKGQNRGGRNSDRQQNRLNEPHYGY